ncbi:MerC family mercury resistance protein [Neolewinella antarctica]|uniref:MerC domain-containing protein n=1 Tax=Neolewinella antarctica TaxID=442734 RepID=A0ABX0XBH1_9BACT|nr:MerC family mercury resistance protein [Neolewinella antarctica]NJC26547.1 hypothetical protein [Neolewinella antarctica]
MSYLIQKPDFVGMLSSGLCAIHCAAAPIFFAAQPLVHGVIGEADHHGHEHGHGLWGSLDFVFLPLVYSPLFTPAMRVSTPELARGCGPAWSSLRPAC